MGISCNNRETKDYVLLDQLPRKRMLAKRVLSSHVGELSDDTQMRQSPQWQDTNGRYRNKGPRIVTQRGTCLPARVRNMQESCRTDVHYRERDLRQSVNITKEVKDNTAIRHPELKDTCVTGRKLLGKN